ncbi:MAG: hypothetical protein ABWY25_06345 [Paenisporosarcina sp.]
MNQLVSIDLVGGVNEEGKGFVTISAVSDTKQLMVGQLPPDIVRDLGRQCFEVAEGAEVDAIIFGLMKNKFGLEDNVIAAFIIDIRNAREE